MAASPDGEHDAKDTLRPVQTSKGFVAQLLIMTRRGHASAARKASQAECYSYNFFANRFTVNTRLDRFTRTLATALRKPLPCQSQALCHSLGAKPLAARASCSHRIWGRDPARAGKMPALHFWGLLGMARKLENLRDVSIGGAKSLIFPLTGCATERIGRTPRCSMGR